MSIEFAPMRSRVRSRNKKTGAVTSCQFQLPSSYRHSTLWMKSFDERPDIGTVIVDFHQSQALVTVRHPRSHPSLTPPDIQRAARVNTCHHLMTIPRDIAIAPQLGIGVQQFVVIQVTDTPDRFYVISQNAMCQAVGAAFPNQDITARAILSRCTIVEALSAVVTQEVFFAALPEARPAPPPTA